MQYIKYKILLCCSIIVMLASCDSEPQHIKPPNIVIIFADDMGYGDLSCYGHPNIKTVHLDKMADEGIRFTSFYAAASVCTPSRAALLTGRYPIRHLPTNLGPESDHGLPIDEVLLSQILKDKGYNTAAIGKWHLGHKSAYLPTSRGFDSFYGLPYSNDMVRPWCPWLSDEENVLSLYEDTVATEEIGFDQDDLTLNYTNKATHFITENKDEPFFLYLAHSMPHLPISTSEQFKGQSSAGLYGDVIETIDWSVGEILATLKESGVDDNTIVVFTSDNGPWQNLPERMLQHGVQPWHTGTAGLLRGAKATTYEGGFRVPAIIRWPDQVTQGQTTDKIITTMDLFSTLVDISGSQLPEVEIDGTSFSPLLKGEDVDMNHSFFYLHNKRVQAIRRDAWKLRYTKSDGIELFNLNNDPSEKFNVADDNPRIVSELLQEMKDFADKTEAEVETI